MNDDPAWSDPEPVELIDRLARCISAEYGAAARDQIVSVIEMLIENGNLEMARIWTRVMHASNRLLGGRRFPGLH